MTSDLQYTPLLRSEINELAKALLYEEVYEFIGGLPTETDFANALLNALNGPPPEVYGEKWINYVARLTQTGELIGRLEATIHDGLAEVAFLYSPAFWGRGYASKGVTWLQEHMLEYGQISSLWGTAHPKNIRSAALLDRLGYSRVTTEDIPNLYSYDVGDTVFRKDIL
ncbi:MAG: GNAT family N-acetyltransferase [Granulosicoccus sp.]